ncbi:MAG: hypothetical protein IT445_09360 [Phycisphaeraceae bacterium]|nr:hypothetical protein [Phycisphaeraceae bacterium]
MNTTSVLKWTGVLVLLASIPALQGCAFLAGAAVGAGGAAAAYEYNAHDESEDLEEDYKEGRITKAEYDARRKQIDESSVTQ